MVLLGQVSIDGIMDKPASTTGCFAFLAVLINLMLVSRANSFMVNPLYDFFTCKDLKR
jgi:hypothetical protein